MTKYREILRLASPGLSQQNIADSSGVSKKTVNRVLKRAKRAQHLWPLEANETDAVLAEKLFHPHRSRCHQQNGCLTSTTSRRSCSEMVSTRSSSGRNTRRNAASPVTSFMYSQFCYYIQQMSRNAGQLCTSTGCPVNRSRSTGLRSS